MSELKSPTDEICGFGWRVYRNDVGDVWVESDGSKGTMHSIGVALIAERKACENARTRAKRAEDIAAAWARYHRTGCAIRTFETLGSHEAKAAQTEHMASFEALRALGVEP